MVSIKTKILIDRFFGTPAVYCLNVLARILGFLLKIDHSLEKPVKNIVVCKFIGMGSVLQTTPMLQTLKLNFPQAKLIFISSKSNKALIESIPLIDEGIFLDDTNFSTVIRSSFLMLFKLWRYKINLYFDLEIYSNYSTIISTLSLAVNRFGYYRRSNNCYLGIYTHMMYFNANISISQIYIQMARMGGCNKIIDELYKLNPKKTQQIVLANLLKTRFNFDLNSNFIVINPNASELVLERRWSSNNFVQLITLILQDFPDINIILTGVERENEYVNNIADQVKYPQVINTTGFLSFTDLVILLDRSQLVISNDSGPMHLSLSLEKRTIGLFGPCSPDHYGRNSKNFHVFYERVYCSPCVHNFDIPPCKGDNQCMKRIVAAEVFNVVKTILKAENRLQNGISDNVIFTQINNSVPLGIVKRV